MTFAPIHLKAGFGITGSAISFEGLSLLFSLRLAVVRHSYYLSDVVVVGGGSSISGENFPSSFNVKLSFVTVGCQARQAFGGFSALDHALQ